jgi:hypothetical protein
VIRIPPKDKVSSSALVLTTQEVRDQLKVIAALTRSTMKEVLARLVAAELKRVAPVANEYKAGKS